MARKKYSALFREKIISYFENGISVNNISKKFTINHTIVARIIIRFRSSGSLATIHGGAGPSSDDLYISENNFITCRSAKKPYISHKNRKARLEFAKAHANWSSF